MCTHLSLRFLLGLHQTKEILRMMSSGSFSYHNVENQNFLLLANKTMPCRLRCHQQDLSPQGQTDISARNHEYQEGCLHFHHIPPLLHAHVCLLQHLIHSTVALFAYRFCNDQHCPDKENIGSILEDRLLPFRHHCLPGSPMFFRQAVFLRQMAANEDKNCLIKSLPL